MVINLINSIKFSYSYLPQGNHRQNSQFHIQAPFLLNILCKRHEDSQYIHTLAFGHYHIDDMLGDDLKFLAQKKIVVDYPNRHEN